VPPHFLSCELFHVRFAALAEIMARVRLTHITVQSAMRRIQHWVTFLSSTFGACYLMNEKVCADYQFVLSAS
jgi:hypothetical protein